MLLVDLLPSENLPARELFSWRKVSLAFLARFDLEEEEKRFFMMEIGLTGFLK
ncbi:MAG: hypothetical protein V1494_02140 [Candidatus Diapherotrites archaeon]